MLDMKHIVSGLIRKQMGDYYPIFGTEDTLLHKYINYNVVPCLGRLLYDLGFCSAEETHILNTGPQCYLQQDCL